MRTKSLYLGKEVSPDQYITFYRLLEGIDYSTKTETPISEKSCRGFHIVSRFRINFVFLFVSGKCQQSYFATANASKNLARLVCINRRDGSIYRPVRSQSLHVSHTHLQY